MGEMKSERLPVTLEPSLLAKVDDYRFSNRIQSRAATVRELIEKGLAFAENEKSGTTA
ncbi:MAG: hypothetical protein LCH99_01825 [Proteobacteria bacterium]|nr:hypothetical protein [Pseudomonadota bacterium]